MSMPEMPADPLPSDEVPTEDWAEQQVDAATETEVPVEAGKITTPIGTLEADEADVVEQETEVPIDDEE